MKKITLIITIVAMFIFSTAIGGNEKNKANKNNNQTSPAWNPSSADSTKILNTIVSGEGTWKGKVQAGYQMYTGVDGVESIPFLSSRTFGYDTYMGVPLIVNPYQGGSIAIGGLHPQYAKNGIQYGDARYDISGALLALAQSGGQISNNPTFWIKETGGTFTVDAHTPICFNTNTHQNVGFNVIDPAATVDIGGDLCVRDLTGNSTAFALTNENGKLLRPTDDQLVSVLRAPVEQIIEESPEIQALINKLVNEKLQEIKEQSLTITESAKLYPNFFENQTNLQLPDGVTAKVQIWTNKGQMIYESQMFQGTILIPTEQISSGRYHFVLEGIKK